jgi:hypothetical protein
MENTIYHILEEIQKKIKVPKNHYNSFGEYNYRSCEDILEAVKPLLPKGIILIVSDSLVHIGDRYYVHAIAKIAKSCDDFIEAHGYARETETKKKMDDSQLTGGASSYARKYALNALLLIDDTKDADAENNNKNNIDSPAKKDPAPAQEPDRKKMIGDIRYWLLKMADKDEKFASNLLKEYSAFKDFKGYSKTSQLEKCSDQQFNIIYHNVTKAYDKYLAVNQAEGQNGQPELSY